MLRNDPRGGFLFGGAFGEEYRGKVGSQAFIADDEAYLVPEGVADLFITRFAPADYMETANTLGLPKYAKQEGRRLDKWLATQETQDYITALMRHLNTPEKGDLIQSVRGRGGGTWLHPKLAVAFARWIS